MEAPHINRKSDYDVTILFQATGRKHVFYVQEAGSIEDAIMRAQDMASRSLDNPFRSDAIAAGEREVVKVVKAL